MAALSAAMNKGTDMLILEDGQGSSLLEHYDEKTGKWVKKPLCLSLCPLSPLPRLLGRYALLVDGATDPRPRLLSLLAWYPSPGSPRRRFCRGHRPAALPASRLQLAWRYRFQAHWPQAARPPARPRCPAAKPRRERREHSVCHPRHEPGRARQRPCPRLCHRRGQPCP